MAVVSYRDLDVWKVGMDFAVDVYKMTREFPNHEKWGLGSQLERAAVSIPANIAEGHARESTKQFLFHVSIARGSVAESETHLLLSQRLGYGNPQTIDNLLLLCDRISKMLYKLQKSLKAKRTPN